MMKPYSQYAMHDKIGAIHSIVVAQLLFSIRLKTDCEGQDPTLDSCNTFVSR